MTSCRCRDRAPGGVGRSVPPPGAAPDATAPGADATAQGPDGRRIVASDPDTARVLLIDVPGGELVVLIVPMLHAIEDSVWEEASSDDGAGTTLERSPLVKIGTEEQGRLLPNVDLRRVAVAELVG
jgi:hypothetical protein